MEGHAQRRGHPSHTLPPVQRTADQPSDLDGKILPPDANELGWKETVRMNPMEDAIVALRPTAPKNQPFEIPNVVRSIDPSMPDGVELRRTARRIQGPAGQSGDRDQPQGQLRLGVRVPLPHPGPRRE